MGFWVSLANFSVWDSCSLPDSAASPLKRAKVSKIATEKVGTGVTKTAFIGVFFMGSVFFTEKRAACHGTFSTSGNVQVFLNSAGSGP